MQRALVVVKDTDAHEELLTEAGELAAGTGADLVVLMMEGLEAIRESRDQYAESEGVTYSDEEVLEAEEEFVADFAENALAGIDVEYTTETAVVEVGERAEETIATAEANDCDHVFIVGQERSPTGKAIFGDMAQSVILNFDGPVTIRTA